MKEGLEVIGQFLKERFQKELEGQDHKATGELIDSINYEVKQTSSGYELLFFGADYGKFLETGTRPHYVPINALIKWIEDKGIATGEKEIKNFAFAIQRKIAQEGTPTSGSYKFSNNGRRKEWITFVASENKAYIDAELLKLFGLEFTQFMGNTIKETNKQMSNGTNS